MKVWRMATGAAWALLFSGSIWWCTHVPYRPSGMLRAVPHDASVVSVHPDLLPRWGLVTSTPFVRRLVQSTGAGPVERISVVEGLLRHLGVRDLTFAYFPSTVSRPEPVWAAVGWVGGRSQMSRWSMQFGGGRGMEAVELSYGRRAWVRPIPEFGGRFLGIAFVEGMAIAALSHNPSAIAGLADCYDGRWPGILNTMSPESIDWIRQRKGRDRGWVRDFPRTTWLFDLKRLTSEEINLQLVWGGVPDVTGRTSRAAANREISSMFASLPRVLGALDGDLLWAAAQAAGFTQTRSLLETLASIAARERVFLVGTGGEYGGRLKGVRVPAFYACVPHREDLEPDAQAADILRKISDYSGVDLWFRPDNILDRRISVIEAENSSFYGRLVKEEKAICFHLEGWTVFCSNRNAFRRLVERESWSRGVSASSPPGILLSESEAAGDVVAFAWADLVLAMKSMRNLLGIFALSQQGQAGGERAMGLYDATRGISEALQTYRLLRVGAGSDRSRVVIDVELKR